MTSIDVVAEAMWRHETEDMPAASRARSSQEWSEQADQIREKWRGFAAVALSAIASRQAVADDLREANRHNLQEIADGAYGDGPLVRGRAREELAKLNSALAAPVRDETEEETEFGLLEDRLPIAGGKARVVERLSASMAGPVPEGPNELLGRLLSQVHQVTAYHIEHPPTPDHEMVQILNGELRELDDRFTAYALAATAPALPEAKPVAWIRGERELALRWMQRLLAKLNTKPEHADDCLWLMRLHALFSDASPVQVKRAEAKPVASPAEGEAVTRWGFIFEDDGETVIGLGIDPEGEWVKFSDVADICARNVRLDREAATREAVIALDRAKERLEILEDAQAEPNQASSVARAAWEDIDAAARALAQQAKPQQAKP